MTYPSEITASRVSVYEVELNLKDWGKEDSSQTASFLVDLSKAIPSLKEHKCMSGKPGGFLLEVQKGTNFAHVIEHVILELIHLADPEKQIYTGWTREKAGEPQQYVIHYSAPDYLTGKLAAILGVELVKGLKEHKTVDADRCIGLLKKPIDYFLQEEQITASEKAEFLAQKIQTILEQK